MTSSCVIPFSEKSKLTGAMAPISSENLVAEMAEEARPSWAGAKAAAEAIRVAAIMDFIVKEFIVVCVENTI